MSQPILLFIDETYLANDTGQIQTVVPVPKVIYQNTLAPECRRLLAQFGREAKEFKGGKLKPRNRRRYKEFLSLFRNLAALVAEHTPLRTVIALGGSPADSDEPFASVHHHIALALARVGITDSDRVAKEFSRQLVWLKEHFDVLSTRAFPNPLVVTFDNQYRYSEAIQRTRAILRDGVELTSFRKLEDVLTVAANCLLAQWTTPVPMPSIQLMTFRGSETEAGLQAADLFSHLFFNYALSDLGHSNDSVRLKADLCQELLPSLTLPENFRTSAKLVLLPDGQMSFELLDPAFGIGTVLGPPQSSNASEAISSLSSE